VTANISGRSKLSRKAAREQRDALLARLMGRTKEGAPLVGESPSPGKNDFDYDKDPNGEKCPHFAHIRRANPRDDGEFIPRIVRRGMSYGPAFREGEEGEVDRGLVFQAYNASLSEQFEIIQRWLSGGNRTAPYSQLSDPFLGVPEAGKPRQYRLADGSLIDLGERPYVRLQWGLYLFVPSRVGLAIIAGPQPDAGRDWTGEGEVTIDTLRALEARDADAAFVAWKRLLEENESLDDEAHRALWQAVREVHKGALATPFGVLVGSAGLVEKVLSQPDDFSVVAYGERLSRCLGPNYLGMDPPEHDDRAGRANAVFNSIDETAAFSAALPRAQGLLKGLGDVGGQATIPMPKYVDLALAEISKHWFGVPDAPTLLEIMQGAKPEPEALIQSGGEPPVGAATTHCPMHVISSSRFVFQPRPTAAVDATASREGQQLRAAMDALVAPFLSGKSRDGKKKAPKWPSSLAREIYEVLKKDGLEEDFASVLLGGLLGYLPTVQGNFLFSVRDWLRERDFWRVQNAYRSARRSGLSEWQAAAAEIRPRLARTMARRPIPAMIHRRATRDLILGGVPVRAGDTIVVGLVSAAAERGFEEVSWVFGGEYYGTPKPTHACPGRQLGMGTLLALIAALFELPGSLRASPSTSALLFDPP
jgi:cytochrome P450